MAWQINNEPAAVFGSLAELIRQALPVLTLLGVIHLAQDKMAGIMILISGSLTFLTIFFTRQQTVTKNTANAQIATALNADPTTTSVQDVITQASTPPPPPVQGGIQ